MASTPLKNNTVVKLDHETPKIRVKIKNGWVATTQIKDLLCSSRFTYQLPTKIKPTTLSKFVNLGSPGSPCKLTGYPFHGLNGCLSQLVQSIQTMSNLSISCRFVWGCIERGKGWYIKVSHLKIQYLHHHVSYLLPMQDASHQQDYYMFPRGSVAGDPFWTFICYWKIWLGDRSKVWMEKKIWSPNTLLGTIHI